MHVVAGITSGQLSLVSCKGNYTVSDYLTMTGFPNWKPMASFLAPVKLSERKYFCE